MKELKNGQIFVKKEQSQILISIVYFLFIIGGIFIFDKICSQIAPFSFNDRFLFHNSDFSTRMLRFDKIADKIDTVFLGSSRAEFGLDPSVFDNTLKQCGLSSHAFNFSVGAGDVYFACHILKHYILPAESKLKIVIIETSEPQLAADVSGVFDAYLASPAVLEENSCANMACAANKITANVFSIYAKRKQYRRALDMLTKRLYKKYVEKVDLLTTRDPLEEQSVWASERKGMDSRGFINEGFAPMVISSSVLQNQADFFRSNPNQIDELPQSQNKIAMEETLWLLQENQCLVFVVTMPVFPLKTIAHEYGVFAEDIKMNQNRLGFLSAISNKYPKVFFIDMDKGGSHDFSTGGFGDYYHLNHIGAGEVTRELALRIAQILKTQNK